MKLQFIGATERVTGSCYLLTDERLGTQFLVDCGQFQGELNADLLNDGPFPFHAADIQFVLLTHAHLDHCGKLPQLLTAGFKGPIYCTAATAQLARIALIDAAQSAAFTTEDVEALDFEAIDQAEDFAFNRPCLKRNGLVISVLRTAHILGSVGFEIHWWDATGEQRSILFSGDLGNHSKANCYLPLLSHRQSPKQAEYMVVESTYGNRAPREPHQVSFEGRIEAWRDHIREHARTGGGPIFVPCFALHRTQEVFFDLDHVLRTTPDLQDYRLCSDAPLAQKMTAVYAAELGRRQTRKNDEPQVRNKQLRTWLDLADESQVDKHLAGLWARLSAFSKKEPVPETERTIVVTGGGMCETGRVIGHIREHHTNPGALLALTGYVPASTLAGQFKALLRDPKSAPATISIGREAVPREVIQMRICDLGVYYSGHADRAGLLNYIFEMPFSKDAPSRTKIFLTHGADEQRVPLKQAIEQRFNERRPGERVIENVVLPRKASWYDLDARGVQQPLEEEVHTYNADLLKELLREQRRTNDLLSRLLSAMTPAKKSKP